MKKTSNEALGELIDSLIEITIAPDTTDDISEQLEPIIEGLVGICRDSDINDPVLDMKKLIDLYLTYLLDNNHVIETYISKLKLNKKNHHICGDLNYLKDNLAKLTRS